MPQKINLKGLNLIKEFEGFRSKAYQDVAGYYTIGYGHKINEYTENYLLKAVLSEELATNLLMQDVNFFEQYLNKVCNDYELNLTQNQYDALISFTFNTGKFTTPMLQRLKAKDTKGVGKALTLYCKAGGQEIPGLLARRKIEQQLFFS